MAVSAKEAPEMTFTWKVRQENGEVENVNQLTIPIPQNIASHRAGFSVLSNGVEKLYETGGYEPLGARYAEKGDYNVTPIDLLKVGEEATQIVIKTEKASYGNTFVQKARSNNP